MQALLGFVGEARWLRYARKSLRGLFPYLPGQSGYNKRLRKLAATMGWLIRILARDTSLWADDVWMVDSSELAALVPGQTLIGDKNYYGRAFEANLARAGLRPLHPARRGEPEPPGRQFFKPLRQITE